MNDELLLQTLQSIHEKINALNDNLSNPISREYLSINDLCKSLNVTRMTVYRYTKDGTLKSYRIAGKVLYKISEVIDAIKEINTFKNLS